MSLGILRHKGAVQPQRYVWDVDEFRVNYCTYSEDINTDWPGDGVTKSGVDTITDDTSLGYHKVSQSNTVPIGGGPAWREVEVKKGTARYVAFTPVSVFGSSLYTIIYDFDTDTFPVTGNTSYVDNLSSEDMGGGWIKIRYLGLQDTGSYVYHTIGLANGGSSYLDANYTGAATLSMSMRKMHVYHERYPATTYVQTTTPKLAVPNGKRVRTRSTTDYTTPSAYTNVMDDAHDFGATWSKNACTITADDRFVPATLTKAYKILDDGLTGTEQVGGIWTSGAQLVNSGKIVSCYMRQDQLTWGYLALTFYGTLAVSAYYDLVNGTVGATLGADNEDQGMAWAGDDWWRCWIKVPADADTNYQVRVLCADADGDISCDRDGTSSIFVSAPMLEDSAGLSEPTSYIETLDSTDVTQVTGANVIYMNKGAAQLTKLATGPYAGFTDAEYKRSKIMYARNVMRHTPRRRYR